jgi:hypothetical protein
MAMLRAWRSSPVTMSAAARRSPLAIMSAAARRSPLAIMSAAARRSPLAIMSAAILIGGCGGSTSSSRPAVAHYIRQVNTIESQLTAPLKAVTSAGSQFASSQGKAVGSLTSLSGLAEQQELLQALDRISVLRGKLAAIDPPKPATRLRKLLLELIDHETGLTRELEQLVVFLPRFARTLTALAPATNALKSALAVSTPLGVGVAGVNAELAVKAQALTTYQAALGAVLRKLGRLRPPAVSRPQYTTQVQTLQQMSSAAGNLARALAGGSSNVAPLLAQFDKAAAGNQSVAAQRAQIAAIRAYDARAAGIDQLARAVEVERARLADTLR